MIKLAQQEIPIGRFQVPNIGPLGVFSGSGDAGSKFNQIISSSVGLITLIAAIWFVFLIITGAIAVMNSAGDKAAVETARKRITNGIVGFVIVLSGIFVVQIIGDLLGYDLILNPAKFIESLGPTTP